MIRKNPLLFSKKGEKNRLAQPAPYVYDWSTLTPVDQGSPLVGGVFGGRRFYNNRLSVDAQYNPYGFTLQTYNGRQIAKAFVNAEPRTGEEYENDFRLEIRRNPWQGASRLPVGSERWYGFRYYFNNTGLDNNVTHGTEISLYQDHPGGVYPTGSNPPLQQVALAYPNQLRRGSNPASDPYWYTPNGGEVCLIQLNGSRDSNFRWSVPGKRVIPGVTKSLLVISYTRYGEGRDGIWKVWIGIDDELPTLAVHPTRPDHRGYTVYAGVNAFSGTMKVGPYHHGLKDAAGLARNAVYGHDRFTCYLENIYELEIAPASPFNGGNWYNLVNPDNYHALLGF
jgi:hypothetical protein